MQRVGKDPDLIQILMEVAAHPGIGRLMQAVPFGEVNY